MKLKALIADAVKQQQLQILHVKYTVVQLADEIVRVLNLKHSSL
jgi:hypothetical protein